jgi:uncharacterized RDD family membrane protein YckC
MDRRVVGSWLDGPGAAARAAGVDLGRPGERLGFPGEGPGSLASFGQRLVAIAIDWIACLLVVRFIARDVEYGSAPHGALTLAVFGLEVALLTWLGGASAGQRLRRLRVVRVDGSPPGLGRTLVRTALLCLAVPALIWDRDGRGLHDKAAGTVVVRAA